MIKTVIRASNDMVIVFDEKGRQLPGYQGKYDDVKEKILNDAREKATFIHWYGVSPEPDVVVSLAW